MENGWQEWTRWIGSIILIPLIAVAAFTILENKSAIAVLQAKVNPLNETLVKMDDKIDKNGGLLIRAVTKLEALEKTDDG